MKKLLVAMAALGMGLVMVQSASASVMPVPASPTPDLGGSEGTPITGTSVAPVPIPSTALLLGPALVGLALWRRRK